MAVHKEILSEKDRILLKDFLEKSQKGKGFRLVKFNLLKNYPNISQDFILLKKCYEKFQKKPI